MNANRETIGKEAPKDSSICCTPMHISPGELYVYSPQKDYRFEEMNGWSFVVDGLNKQLIGYR
jgi:hypothetical protein